MIKRIRGVDMSANIRAREIHRTEFVRLRLHLLFVIS